MYVLPRRSREPLPPQQATLGSSHSAKRWTASFKLQLGKVISVKQMNSSGFRSKVCDSEHHLSNTAVSQGAEKRWRNPQSNPSCLPFWQTAPWQPLQYLPSLMTSILLDSGCSPGVTVKSYCLADINAAVSGGTFPHTDWCLGPGKIARYKCLQASPVCLCYSNTLRAQLGKVRKHGCGFTIQLICCNG